MYLEVISKIVDFDTYTISDAGRLKLVKQLLNCWKLKKKWTKNLNDVPAITGACGQDFLLPPAPRYFLRGGGGKSLVHKHLL